MVDPASQEPLGLGVIGCGGIAQSAHLPAISRTDGAELVAVADVAGDLARKVAHSRGLAAASAYSDHRPLLDCDDVDAVVVCVPTPCHAEVSIDALGAGKHVLVEKPMANSTEEAERMAEAAKAANRTLMVGYNHSYDLASQYVRDMLVNDELGDLLYGELFFYLDLQAWHAGAYTKLIRSSTPRPGRKTGSEDPRQRTFGFVQAFGSHLLNLVRVLIGDPKEIEYATQIEGAGLWVMFDYGGFKVYFKNVLSKQDTFEKGLELVGSRRRVRLELAPPLQRHSPGTVSIMDVEDKTVARPVLPDRWPFELELEHFISCVREGVEPLTSGVACIKDVTLAEDIAALAHEA